MIVAPPPRPDARRSGGTLIVTVTRSSALLDLLRLRRAAAYGAGPGLDQALDVCRRLKTYGMVATTGYWPKVDEPKRSVADAHLAAFERLALEGLDCYVSIRLTSLAFDAALFTELAAAAARSGRRVHVDSLGAETADATLRLLESAPNLGSIGMTLPGRWVRSLEDSSRATALGLRLRVVKGQWADDRGGSVDPARGFLAIVDRLCGYDGGVAIATHNVKLLRESLRRLTATGTPCETELIIGLPFRGPLTAAREFGVPVRVYVPYGDAWASYGVTDLIGHPATVRWLIQDLLLGEDKTWRSLRRSSSDG